MGIRLRVVWPVSDSMAVIDMRYADSPSRFSEPYRKFLESLTATFSGDGFLKAAAANHKEVKIHEGPRGAPENVGAHLTTVHPVVRTNPVTGWKSLFAVGPFPKYINELDLQESEELLALFKRRIHDSHDLTVRFKWRNENDIGKLHKTSPVNKY